VTTYIPTSGDKIIYYMNEPFTMDKDMTEHLGTYIANFNGQHIVWDEQTQEPINAFEVRQYKTITIQQAEQILGVKITY
jgi:hypothetical protein